MQWEEFKQLLSGIGPDTPLGRIVQIRSETDPDRLKSYSPAMNRIRGVAAATCTGADKAGDRPLSEADGSGFPVHGKKQRIKGREGRNVHKRNQRRADQPCLNA